MNITRSTTPPSPVGTAAAVQTPKPEADRSDARVSAAPPEKTVAPAQQPPSSEAVRKVAQQINEFLKSTSTSVEFAVDDDSSKVVVRIVDAQTKELIRQIPSEEMIAMSKAIDTMSGLLIRQKA